MPLVALGSILHRRRSAHLLTVCFNIRPDRRLLYERPMPLGISDNSYAAFGRNSDKAGAFRTQFVPQFGRLHIGLVREDKPASVDDVTDMRKGLFNLGESIAVDSAFRA